MPTATHIKRTRTPHHTHVQGFSLLEVMVALLIFSVGLLGLAGLQLSGVQNNQKALIRSIAIQQAYDMAERLRSNRKGVEDGEYDNVYEVDEACKEAPSLSCTSISQRDKAEWDYTNRTSLPSGQGEIKVNRGNTGEINDIDVIVRWDEDRTGATGTTCPPAATTDLSCYTLTVLP